MKKDFDAPKLITRHDIDQLAKESEKKISEEYHMIGEVVEHRVIRTRLNGYETQNPYNKKAKSLEIAFYVSVMAKDILEEVDRVVEKYFHLRNNQKSSFSLAAFSAISAILPGEHDFMIVDVRGEVTDISLITDGALMKNLSFAQGKNALIKVVADGSGQSVNTALSSIRLALSGSSEPLAQDNVMKFAEKFKQAWLQEYAKTEKDISIGTILPPIIFLLTDSDIEIFFENMMNEIKEDGVIHLLKNLRAIDYLEKSSVATDQFLALESIFATIV